MNSTSRFIESVLENIRPGVDKLVVVTHLVPGVDTFLMAVHKVIPIAAVIPKPNSIDARVMEALSLSVPVLPFTRDQIKERPRHFIHALRACLGDSRFAIIDTGGYFSHVLREMHAAFGEKLLGIVEDTENGHQKYESLLSSSDGGASFPCPVMSVARSELKDPEDFLVGQAIVFSAEALLREQGTILTGKRAVVFGFGKIGRSIAQNLHSKSVRVDVIDTHPCRQVLALAQGYHTDDRTRLLGDVDLVFCATGNRSLKSRDLASIRRDAYVFTATSADDEIEDHLALTRNCTYRADGKIARIEVGDSRFFLCNNGNSVNFVHGGVVCSFIRLVQAELVFAVSQLADFPRKDRISQLNDDAKRFIAELWLHHFAKT
jgi:adenosylhomocysteinase